MRDSIRPLLNRRPLGENESLPSFLQWLGIHNHYTVKTTLQRICERYLPESPGVITQPVTLNVYKVLGEITRVDPMLLYQATPHPFAPVLTPPPNTYTCMEMSPGVCVPLLARSYATKFLWADKDVQFCPACLSESLHHRVNWLPLSVAACLKHQCLLQRRCPSCFAAISIASLLTGHCPQCDFDWQHTPVTHIGHDEWGLFSQTLIQSWLGLTDFPQNTFNVDCRLKYTDSRPCDPCSPHRSNLDSVPDNPVPYHNQKLGLPATETSTLFYILYGLSRGVAGMSGTNWIHPSPVQRQFPLNSSKTTLFPAQIYVLFATALRALENWPHGFYKFLDRLSDPGDTQTSFTQTAYSHSVDEKNSSPSITGDHLQKAFRNIYVCWLERSWRHGDYQFVQDAFDDYLRQRYLISPSLLRLRRVRDNPSFKSLLPYITEAEAGRILDCGPQTIKLLVEKEVLISYERVYPDQPQPQFNLVRREEVVALRRRWHSALPLSAAAIKLGASTGTVLSLVDAGLLKAVRGPTVDGSQEWRLDEKSITNLQSRLKKCLSPSPLAEAVTLTKTVQTLSAHGYNTTMVVQAILEGRLRAYGQNGGLHELEFDPNDVEDLRAMLYQARSLLSRGQVAKMLGVKPRIVQSWVDRGLLERTGEGDLSNSPKFTQQQIERFRADYVFTDEAAQMLGIGELAVQKWARHGRLHPVCGGDGSELHRYLFCRDEVEKFRPENRLSAPELAKIMGLSRNHIIIWIKEDKVRPVSGPGVDGMKHYLFLRSQLSITD